MDGYDPEDCDTGAGAQREGAFLDSARVRGAILRRSTHESVSADRHDDPEPEPERDHPHQFTGPRGGGRQQGPNATMNMPPMMTYC